MRLHHLTVQAFGPFAGRESVDFDQLGAAGLFLVHGPTGAGKTSVLDAVCFALYGQVPGVREAAKSPRSTHAGPGVRTEVELELTVRGRRLRFTRSPSWRRPKKRGSGTTEEKAKVAVSEYRNAAWEPVTSRLDEAGLFAADTVGLTRDQFCQVVLLPQGEFARFLRAGAQERAQALQRIFNAEVFAQVEKWLAEHSKALGREAAAAEEGVLRQAQALAEAGRSAVPAEAAESAEGLDALLPWAAELAAVTAADAADAAPAAARAAADRDAARTAEERTRAAAGLRRRHAEAAERSAALTARSGHRAALDAELAAADRAAGVLPVIGAARARRDELAKAEQDAAEQRALAAGLGPAPGADDPLQSGAERLRAAERERRDEIARLAHLRGDADRAAALAYETSQIAAALERARSDGAAAAEHAARLPERRASIAAALAEARTRTGPREAAEEALEAARARSAAVADAARLGTELARAAAARRSAVDAAQAAQDALLEVRRRRLDGMAAELAAGLEAGAPCPVCGAAEHPAPSAGGADRPSGADEERARSAADAARDRRTGAERAEAGLEAQHAAVLERAGGLDSAAAAELVRSRTAALDELDAARAQADQLARRLEEADTELERARTAAARRDREAAELAERHTARTAEARALAERLDAARGTDPDLPSRTARLEAEADLLAGAAAAADRRSAAAAELRTAEGELRRAVAEAGFDDADAAGRAARDGAARSALTAQAREYDTALAAARAVLAEPETAAAAAGPEPDTAAAAAALRRTEAAADAAHAWHDRLVQRGARCTEMRGELERLLTASRPARERHRVADGLARLAAGTSPANQHSVRLSSYVLAARLEQVVAAANDRLATMSGGRYALRHTVEAAAGDRSHSGGGLGLRAVDAWTGQERDPATLSGGESFIASLALALGLADVATEEAGGTDIGTLFVDEGFGTLDEDTLEEVMDVLDRLRDGGRAVGVVSHVADLRARIPSRLHVRKSPAGSHLHQTP